MGSFLDSDFPSASPHLPQILGALPFVTFCADPEYASESNKSAPEEMEVDEGRSFWGAQWLYRFPFLAAALPLIQSCWQERVNCRVPSIQRFASLRSLYFWPRFRIRNIAIIKEMLIEVGEASKDMLGGVRNSLPGLKNYRFVFCPSGSLAPFLYLYEFRSFHVLEQAPMYFLQALLKTARMHL